MSQSNKQFALQSKLACENVENRNILKKNIINYNVRIDKAKEQFSDYKLARKKLYYLKYKTIENLENHINEFEKQFSTRGGKVIYAPNKIDALNFINEIIKNNNAKKIIKSKSTICEELELEHFLNNQDVKVIESNLGRFIAQIAKEDSSHIVSPIIHKSKEQICKLLNEEYKTLFDNNTPSEQIIEFIRNIIRNELKDVKVGITGCNFLIADVGAIAISENEANVMLTAGMPPIHIVVASVEKIIYQFNNLELFQSMLSTNSTGQKLSSYNHIIFGPYKNQDSKITPKIYVILVDNNRSQLLSNTQLRESCYCIKCGACHNSCPIYKIIGGNTYDTIYNGPIGSVISPFIFGEEKYMHLPYTSTLCGKCNEVCPANIDITGLLIENRKKIVDSKINSTTERFVFNKMHYLLMKRKRIENLNSRIKNISVKLLLKQNWGLHRELPTFSKLSFNKQQKNKNRAN